jgi:glucose dehydrogenase
MCCESLDSRLAYADGKIIKYEADTTLVALDANTGKELWKTRAGDPRRGEVGDRMPYVVDGKVLIGVSGGEFGLRGYVTSLDVKTGKSLWRAYSKGPDEDILFDPKMTMAEGKPVGKDSSLKTWTGDQWRTSPATQESKPVFDPALKLMFYVVGENTPFQPQARQQGSTRTVFARSIDSGEARWIYSPPAADDWLDAGGAELSLGEREVNGKKLKTLEYRDAAGNLLTLERETGKLVESIKTKAAAAPEGADVPFRVRPDQH